MPIHLFDLKSKSHDNQVNWYQSFPSNQRQTPKYNKISKVRSNLSISEILQFTLAFSFIVLQNLKRGI